MKGKKDPNGNKLKELDTKEELILSNLENKFNAKLEQYKIKYADYLKKLHLNNIHHLEHYIIK